METIATKSQILEDAGYFFSFAHEIYVNRQARTVFSLEFVEDRTEAEIEKRLARPLPAPGEWQFHFVKDPSDAVKRDLKTLLG